MRDEAVDDVLRSGRSVAIGLGFVVAAAAFTALVIGRERIAESSLGKGTPLLMLLALAFGALVIRYSAAGVTILVTFIYMNLSEALVRYHEFPSLLQLLVIALALAAWLKRDTADLREIVTQPLTALLIAWMVLLFASTAWSADREMADDRFLDVARAFALFALATLLMRNRRRLLQGVFALVASACALAALTLYQFATGSFDTEFGGIARIKQAQIYGDVFEARVAGPIGDPNFFAQALLLALPIPVVLAFNDARPARKVLWATAAAAIFATLVITYSRGAMVAMAVMTVMLLKELHVRWRSTAVAAVAVSFVLLLLPSDMSQRLLTIAQVLPSADAPLRPDSSFQERRLLMQVAWVMFAANPVAGVGVGNYSARYDEYAGSTASSARQYASPSDLHFPHNLALEAAAENGILGVAILAATFVAAWLLLRQAQQTFASTDPTLSHIAAAMKVALAGFLVSSLFLHLALPRFLLLLFAFAVTLQRLSRPETELPQ